jgi:hypothetical protein
LKSRLTTATRGRAKTATLTMLVMMAVPQRTKNVERCQHLLRRRERALLTASQSLRLLKRWSAYGLLRTMCATAAAAVAATAAATLTMLLPAWMGGTPTLTSHTRSMQLVEVVVAVEAATTDTMRLLSTTSMAMLPKMAAVAAAAMLANLL